VLVSALLHDVGKLVLLQAYAGYPDEVHGEARTPESRLRAEGRGLGVDHSLVGGVLARRWHLPLRLASVIERHHSEKAAGDAAIVRLAEMLAHYMNDQPVDRGRLLEAARAVGLDSARPALHPVRAAPGRYDRAPARRPVSAVEPRARDPQAARGGEALQADRSRPRALDEHGQDPPPQHLRQGRRG
jgi:HDOD domain